MATTNFMRYEANNIYTIDAENDTIEDTVGLLKSKITKLDMENITKGPIENNIKFNPNYPGTYITTVYTDKSYGDVDFEIAVHIVILNGYYEDANIDYLTDVYINGVLCGNMSTIRDDYFHLIDYTDKMNKGICTIQTKNVKKWADKVYKELTNKLELILKSVSKEVLTVEGTFSNGETIYNITEEDSDEIQNLLNQ